MRILFTPAGDTDPVRGYYDGAILHILRHYEVDKVIVVLTKDMEKKEEWGCYTTGIRYGFPDMEISYIRTGITEPHKYEVLTQVQDEFDKVYRENPEAEWLINTSSGTPQLKTVMALLVIDYPHAKAIQVSTPEGASNKNNPACKNLEEVLEMLDNNLDEEDDAKNRCDEPPLYLLKRHGLIRQIISLVENYEYDGALRIVRQNKDCGFSEDTEKLLQHAVYRRDLMWKKANQEISQYEGKPLLVSPDDFTEYFRVMEMRQRKKQYPEFIVKLSPILLQLGTKYIQSLQRFELSKCGYKDRDGTFIIDREKTNQAYPGLIAHIEKILEKKMQGGYLYFSTIVWICEYLKENQYRGDEKHENVTGIFEKLRIVEEKTRNPVAHEITNLSDERIRELTAQSKKNPLGIVGGLSSKEIMKLLHDAVRLIYGRDIRWNYDDLNAIIIDSLRKR